MEGRASGACRSPGSGLDIFFAISGYMVTGSWLRTPQLGTFLWKRTLRILPGLTACVLFTTFILGARLTRFPLAEYLTNPGTLGYLSNIILSPALYLPGVFRGPPGRGRSQRLALELVPRGAVLPDRARLCPAGDPAPAMGAGGARTGDRRSRDVAVLRLHGRRLGDQLDRRQIYAGAGAALLLRRTVNRLLGDQVPNFYRADFALLGYSLNWMVASWYGWWNIPIEWVTLPYMVLCFGRLSMPVIRRAGRFGDLSYGMYLYAFPVQQVILGARPDLEHPIIACMLLTVPFALVSWHLIEAPFLRLKPANLLRQAAAEPGVPGGPGRPVTGPAVRASGGKVVFADQLRGVAALVVVLSHFFNVYPFAQPIVSATVAAPRSRSFAVVDDDGDDPALDQLRAVRRWPVLSRQRLRDPVLAAPALAHCLPAGAVPPHLPDLLGRIGRRLPAGRGIGRAIGDGRCRSIGPGSSPMSRCRTRCATCRASTKVNWTLVVELRFYLFAALARPWILRSSLLPMLASVAGALALMAVQRAGLIGRPSFLEYIAMSLPYMLIGTAFHYHYAGALRGIALVAVVAGLGGAFVALYWTSPARAGSVIEVQSYGIAAGLFALAYSTRRSMPDLLPLRWLARISYPLYAVHFLAGLSIMTWLIAGPLQWSYPAASAATLAVVLAIATALHIAIERPTIAWGSALGRPSPGHSPSYDPNNLASSPRGATSAVLAIRPGQSE